MVLHFVHISKVPPFSASAEEETTVLRLSNSIKIGPPGLGVIIKIRHTVCKRIVACNASAGCRENKVSSICVSNYDHIVSVRSNSGMCMP